MVVFVVLLARNCSRADEKPFAREYHKSGGDTLDIAIEMSPTIYAISAGQVSGHDYELLQQISREHGIGMKFHPFVQLSEALDGLEQGDYDLVAASMPLTSDLKERFLMTDPVYLNREILVQHVDSNGKHGSVTSQLQLARDTVWIAADSPFADRIGNLAAEIGDTIYIQSSPEYTAEHLFILVAKGIIKLAVVNETVAKAMRADYPQVDISTPVSFTQFQSWAVSPERPELLDSINAWLK